MKEYIFKTCHNGRENLTVDVYDSGHPSGNGFVFYAGGGWINDNRRRFRLFAEDLNRVGYTVFLPQYRVYGIHHSSPREGVEDVVDGLKFIYGALLRPSGIDRDRVIWSGSSAGAHLILCAALLEPFRSEVADMPEKLVLFQPVCRPSSLDLWLKDQCGRSFDFAGISPLDGVRESGAEILAMHGTDDKIAPFRDLEQFAARYGELGGCCHISSYEGRNHGFWLPGVSPEDYQSVFEEMMRFLQKKKETFQDKP